MTPRRAFAARTGIHRLALNLRVLSTPGGTLDNARATPYCPRCPPRTPVTSTLVVQLFLPMGGVEYIYRVLALGGVGAIFLVGSLLYHRYFRLPASEEST